MLRFLPFLLLFSAFAQTQNADTVISFDPVTGDAIMRIYFGMMGKSRLASIERTTTFNSCRVPTGIDSFFHDKPRNIVRLSRRYEHYKSTAPDAGCHGTWTVTTTAHHDAHGRRTRVVQHKSGYETERCPCGTWTTYNAGGKAVRTQKHPDCKKQELECAPATRD